MSKYSENMPPDLRKAIGWMFSHIKEDKTFLDFGCSTGYFGALIKKAKNNKVYGVEISKDVEKARQVLDAVYSFDLDGDWPEEVYERTYDYLFFGDVIEHLKDPETVLEKCRKLLKKDGIIFISTPNIAHISIRLELMSGNFEYEPMGILDETHLKYFTKKSLTKLVRDAGYHINLIDFTANDYPDSVIKKMLAANGLEPTEKFWKIVNSPEARAFQYKLIIAPGVSKKPAGRGAAMATDKPEAVRNAHSDDLKEQVSSLRAHSKEQAKIIEHQRQETENLKERLRHIESSRAYRLAKKTRKIYRGR